MAKRRQNLDMQVQTPRDSLISTSAKLAVALAKAAGVRLTPELRAALTRPPCKNPRAFAFFARAEMMRLRGGNAFEADKYRQWIERAAELDMDFFDAAQRLAELDLQRGDFRAAILALTNATRIRPDWVDGYNQLASVLGAYQAPDKVIEVSRKALKVDPQNVPALANLGAAYLDKGLPDSAIFYLRQALQEDPDNWRLLYNLGAAYTKKGQWQKAIETLRKALNKRSDVPEIHYFLGVAYNNAGMPGEAVRWFRRTVQLDPQGPYGKLARKHLTTILGYVPGNRR
ncbi:MAG: tetratricopeptide repeat protein [Calditrichaeota bacterium]|nr:tetratricopeptide repeat protein [Calditrichota bacterium]